MSLKLMSLWLDEETGALFAENSDRDRVYIHATSLARETHGGGETSPLPAAKSPGEGLKSPTLSTPLAAGIPAAAPAGADPNEVGKPEGQAGFSEAQ